MSTELTASLDDSYEILVRILQTLDLSLTFSAQIKSHHSQKFTLTQKTFEQSLTKSKPLALIQIANKIQASLYSYLKNQKTEADKYEQHLQFLQAKLRKHSKTQIENRIHIENLEQDSSELKKQIIRLNQQIIALQKQLDGTQHRMNTQIKTLQTQIQNFKRFDQFFMDKTNKYADISKQQSQNTRQNQKKTNVISMIKNRLSLCEINQFDLKSFTNQLHPQNSHVRQKYTKFQTNKNQIKALPSRRLSVRSLSIKSSPRRQAKRQLKRSEQQNDKSHKKSFKGPLIINTQRTKQQKTKNMKDQTNRPLTKLKGKAPISTRTQAKI